MAAPSDYLDVVDLVALVKGGFVNEDVDQKIYQLEQLDTPVLNRIGRDTIESMSPTWVIDTLGSASDTKIVSGADVGSYEAATGSRVGNHAQINARYIAVTGRARATNNIGRSDEFVYQSMMAGQRLKQDIEKQILGRQASVVDNNNATAGVSAGLSAWIATNDSSGSGGSSPGYNTSTGVVDAPVTGSSRVLTQALWRAQVLNAYNAYSDVSLMVSTPTMVQTINTFLVGGSGVLRATPTANVTGEKPVTGQAAQGHFSIIVTDFGTVLSLVPDRHQATYTSAGTSSNQVPVVDVFLLNPEFIKFATLRGFRVEPLAKLGDSDRAQHLVDWTLKVTNEKAHAVIRDILPSGTVTA